MTGDEEPRPGISTFQRMFFVSLHSVGGLASFDTPVAYGPRHCGQKRSASARAALWRPAAAGSTDSSDASASAMTRMRTRPLMTLSVISFAAFQIVRPFDFSL